MPSYEDDFQTALALIGGCWWSKPDMPVCRNQCLSCARARQVAEWVQKIRSEACRG